MYFKDTMSFVPTNKQEDTLVYIHKIILSSYYTHKVY